MENITEFAAKNGQRVDNWMRLKSTQKIIKEIDSQGDAPSIIVALGRNLPPDVRQMLFDCGVKNPIQGTYACEEIAEAFKAWCKKEAMNKPSCVYLIRGDKTDSFKIGISSNPRSRLKQMQTGSPVKLLLTRSVEVQDPELLEQKLHAAFSCYKIHGEWFSMPWKKAVEAFDSIVSGT